MARPLLVAAAVAAGATSAVFAGIVLGRYASRQRPYLLLWGIGLLLYAVGAFTQAYYSLWGFHSLIFKLWYVSGAVLVAAFLGQGTAYLLLPRPVAHALMGLLGTGSLWAAWRVFSAQVDPALLTGPELTGKAIVTPGVRSLTPVFNVYGTLLLVGGALYSAWALHRRGLQERRMVGNLLIAAGGMAPAVGGILNRFGLPGLYLGELVGAVVMYLGFLRTLEPAPVRGPVRAAGARSAAR